VILTTSRASHNCQLINGIRSLQRSASLVVLKWGVSNAISAWRSDSMVYRKPAEVVSPCLLQTGHVSPNQQPHGLGERLLPLTGNDNPQQLHLVSCCCPKVQPQPLLNLDLTPRLVFHFKMATGSDHVLESESLNLSPCSLGRPLPE